ncbi:L-histidine N(alpha)-methyltransferase [Micromonospora sp. NPDC005215]|uniref:L-histidine N(alpha)-methyltransferase n=1 Tax=Micromonospora sp. NPDC005215 TaxID=3157024 RepID=UPI0033B129EE
MAETIGEAGTGANPRAQSGPPGDPTRCRPPHFECERHRRAALAAIHAGQLPLKFAYAGSAAHTHDAYARTDDYLSMLASARHEAEALLAAQTLTAGALAVAEIGPGNGKRSSAFLNRLTTLGHPCRRYLALDFSATLLAIACHRLAHFAGGQMSVDSHVWDIESGASQGVERWRPGPEPVVACLLGHTLGNLECPTAALANIRASLRPRDVLVLSVVVGRPDEPAETVLAPYRCPEFRDAALEPLLAAGLPEVDLDFVLRWGDGAVTGEAVLRRPGVLDGTLLPAGHRIRCFQSRRFSYPDVIAAVRDAGWRIRHAALASGSHHLVITASRW